MQSAEGRTGLRRALTLMISTSLLVPVAGVVTAPMLAHGLGVTGRGVAAAAVAPNALIVSVATLGLPEALTFYLAKFPRLIRTALAWSTGIGLLLGLLCLLAVQPAIGYLSSGDGELAGLIQLAVALAVPQLLVNLLRGAASGLQLWQTVANERLANSLLRIIGLVVLLLTGRLTVLNAVLVLSIAPVVAGLVYGRLLWSRRDTEEPLAFPGRFAPSLLGFGVRVWAGAVASMLLARIGLVLFAPLSDVDQLGLYIVAIAVSDVPLIVAIGIRDALYGVSSRAGDAEQVALTSRVTLLVGLLGSLVLGASLPLWMGLAFGPGFAAALLPTWVLMGCAVINIPGFLAAAGIGAWGRPGLRSAGLGLTLLVNLPLFVLLVPAYGALGGALAGVASSTVSTAYMVLVASRVIQLPAHRFLVVTRADLHRLRDEGRTLLRPRRVEVPAPTGVG